MKYKQIKEWPQTGSQSTQKKCKLTISTTADDYDQSETA